MEKKRIYVDIHVLQTVPPSCVNRDDTGSPKTAIYGGVTRARVSSQSWKRAIRDMFKDIFPQEDLGLRTRRIVDMLVQEMEKDGSFDDPEKDAKSVLAAAGLSIKSSDKGTGAMFFMSRSQVKALTAFAKANPEVLTEKPSAQIKQEAHNLLKANPSIDVALFGRMVAEDPSLNTDATAQVAHAISTHKVNNEFDYFTAVDDLAPEDSAGAGHLGTVEFNSATLYRYATIAVHALHQYLDEDTAAAVSGFVDAFVCSMPTGKQNTFANRTLPDAVLVTLRTDQPINFVGAFEKPVPAGVEGYVASSAARLKSHAQNVYLDFASEPETSLVVGEMLEDLGERQPFDKLLVSLKNMIDEYWS